MPRNPSHPGDRKGGPPVTLPDGTWPLPDAAAREIVPPLPQASVSGPVEALRRPAASVTHSAAAPAFPRPPRPARPPGLRPALQKLWAEVLDRHDALAEQDHFLALGIPYEAHSAEIQDAFKDLIARLHPDKLPGELALLKPYAVRIVARLNVARMMLSTRHDREAYLRKLGRPVPPASSAPPPSPAAARAVAKIRPERRAVPRPESGPVPVPARELPLRPQPPRPRRDSAPPGPGARFWRALRRERPSSH